MVGGTYTVIAFEIEVRLGSDFVVSATGLFTISRATFFPQSSYSSTTFKHKLESMADIYRQGLRRFHY